MSSEERPKLQLTDPTMVRAIAHPVRMALLEAMEQSESKTLTATQASELLGESPANCAFHLRTLAKYGFVTEAGGGRGRERPWRLAYRGFEIVPPWPDTESRVAVEAAASVWIDRWLDRARTLIRRVLAHPPEWQQAAIASQRVLYLTAPEAVQLATDMHELWDRFAGRADDPAQRPPGSLPFEVLAFGYPLAEPPGSGSE
ncbi:MAG: helix-turn-helix domain-containing protein [Streptosporangiaceae bacterium]